MGLNKAGGGELRLDEFQKKILVSKYKGRAEITFEEGTVSRGLHKEPLPHNRITVKAKDMFSTVLSSCIRTGAGFVKKDLEQIREQIEDFLEKHE